MNKGASGKDSLIVFGLYVREDQTHVGLYLFLWVATALGGESGRSALYRAIGKTGHAHGRPPEGFHPIPIIQITREMF